jgi:hypothetical protein
MVPSEGDTDRGTPGSGQTTGKDERSQANVLGLTLVFGLVIVGSVVVVAFGASAISDSQETLSVQRAEKAMTQFDSRAALVALGNTDIQRIDFGSDAAAEFDVDKDAGYMRITRENLSSGDTTQLVQEDLGAIVYETDTESLAYQGGGVWRVSGDSSVMVSPPEFHFRNGTLTLPIIQLVGNPSLGSRISVAHNETLRKYPVSADKDRFNPLTNHKVTVTLKSDYYQAWGTYFETRTDGEVSYDHANNIANLTLVSPIQQRKITAATASLSASGTFEINGGAGSQCSADSDNYSNSYNSSKSGDYCDQAASGNLGDNGDIVYGENVDISDGSGTADLHGNIISGGAVRVTQSSGNQPYVIGHINYTTDCYQSVGDCQNRSSGSVNQISGIKKASEIDFFVENTIEEIKGDNDNGGAPIDASNRLEFGGSNDVELTSGTYYLDRIDFDGGSGDEIILNTSGGSISIAVEGDVNIPDNAEMEIEGDGYAEMYVGNNSGHKTNSRWAFKMGKESGVLNDGDDAEQFRLYGKSSMDVSIGDGSGGGGNQAKYVGVVYAPPGNNGNGTVLLDKGEVFGGVIVGTTKIENSGSIHYDEALKNKQVISRGAKVVRVTYLHISVNRIDIAGR